jgi:hypothetical protein
VTEAVIDVFEIVEINEEQSQLVIRPRRLGNAVLEAVGEQRPVRQPGQFVMGRHELDAVLRGFDRADVAEHGDIDYEPCRHHSARR